MQSGQCQDQHDDIKNGVRSIAIFLQLILLSKALRPAHTSIFSKSTLWIWSFQCQIAAVQPVPYHTRCQMAVHKSKLQGHLIRCWRTLPTKAFYQVCLMADFVLFRYFVLLLQKLIITVPLLLRDAVERRSDDLYCYFVFPAPFFFFVRPPRRQRTK